MAYDRGARVAYLVINRWPTIVKLIPQAEFAAAKRRGTLNGARAEFGAQSGTPFGMARIELFCNHLPCLEGPWSTLVAVDLDRGEVLWERGVGTPPFVQADNPASNWGYQQKGGPLVTQGGVVFLATTYDNMLHAHHGATGEVLWSRALPANSHATPMGFRHEGMDYIVVTAGGGLASGRGGGDHVVAYRLAAGETPVNARLP